VRRWRIERLFAWLLDYRRLTICGERHAESCLGFVQLGFIGIPLRHF
jgi:transposase